MKRDCNTHERDNGSTQDLDKKKKPAEKETTWDI